MAAFPPVLIFLALCPFLHWGQTLTLPAEQITSDSGMVAEWIYSISQDRLGFMWFGTNLGVARHDGIQYKVFRRANTLPHPLSNDYVLSIAEDQEGDLWMGTANGLNRFQPASETFSVFRHDAKDPQSLSGNFITHLAIWKARPDWLWVSTWDGGLNCFNMKTGKCRRFAAETSRPNAKPGNWVNMVREDSRGRIWVAASNGLFRFDPETGDFEAFRHDAQKADTISDNNVFSIHESKSRPGVLWVGTARNDLNRFDPERRSWERFALPTAEGSNRLANVVYSITEYPHEVDMLLIGTRQGLFTFDTIRHSWQWVLLQDQFRETGNHRDEMILEIFNDRSGVCWIGVQGRGLFKFVPQQVMFNSHTNPGPADSELIRNTIYSIAEDRSGRLWLGTYGDGLYHYTPASERFEHFPLTPPVADGDDFQIIGALCVTRQDEMWAASGGGLVLIRLQTGEQKFFPADPKDPTTLGFNKVAAIREDSQGDVWIGSDHCLLRWNRRTQTFSRYQSNANDPNTLSSNHINPILEDRSGNIWIGTENGLNLFDRRRGVFKRYYLDIPEADKETQNYIMILHQDRRGRLWIGTSNGLNLMDANGGSVRFQHYSSPGSTVRNFILSIAEDDSENLWIASSGGLSRFDMRTRTFSLYDSRDGVPPINFIYGSSKRSRSGEIFFGGRQRMISFKPWLARRNTYVPPLAFTDIRFRHRPVPIGAASPLNRAIGLTSELVLPYNLNNLSLSFAALSFIRPEKNQYAYRLDGRDDSWHTLGFENTVTLDNLKPGSYRLRIRGSNNEGVWNEAGVSLALRIRPPFWQTWWFRAMLALAVIALFIQWYRTRVERIAARIRTEAAMENFFNKYRISEREKEIVHLLIKGKSNKEIEDELFISMGTVKNHIYNIFQKLGVKNRAQLITLFKNLRSK